MEIMIIGEFEEFDSSVAKIDAWYDRHTRDWVVELLNKDGYQIGDVVRCPDKKAKDSEVKYLKEKYNL